MASALQKTDGKEERVQVNLLSELNNKSDTIINGKIEQPVSKLTLSKIFT